MEKDYLYHLLSSSFIRKMFEASAAGAVVLNLNSEKVRELPIPLPPLPEQHRIVAKIDELMARCDELEQQIGAATTKQSELLNALLHVQPQKYVDIIDLSTYRSAIGCYIVKNLASSPYFGRPTAAKVLYLAQAHASLNLDLHPVREAAGPFDKWIYDFDQNGKSNGWFTVKDKRTKAGHTKAEYNPMQGLEAQVSQAEKAMTVEERRKLDSLIRLLADKKTEEAEIIATLFAAWNDLLIDSVEPNDNRIITEVRENWHERKSRFSPETLNQWIDWMRHKELVPQGRSPKAIQQYRLDL